MANVIVDKNKIDLLANAIADKSGEPVTMTLEEMVEAVDSIETGGGGITPTGNINITQAGVTDVTNYATATVPSGEFGNDSGVVGGFRNVDNVRKWKASSYAQVATGGYIEADYYTLTETYYNAVPANTAVTPTESSQTIGGADYMMEGAVTVNAISSTYVGTGITRRNSSDLSASGATVSVPSGYYESNVSKAVASGTAGTPTATKGTVSNHSVSVTPSVTNTTGYITGSTKTGTAVTVSASELVSGSQNITQNGTVDVTNLAEVVVNVSGGSLTVATKTLTNTSTTQTLSFSSLSGQPKYWFLRATTNVSSSGSTTYYYVTDLFYDGTSVKGNCFRIGSTRRVQNITSGVTQSYSGNTLTITAGSVSTATPGQFYGTTNFGYELVYIY